MPVDARRVRLRAERGANRAAIVVAAEGALRERPFREVSVEELMQAAGLARTQFYRYFDDKEDLYMPGILRATLQPGESFTLVASAEPPETIMPFVGGALERERARQGTLLRQAGVPVRAEDGDAADPNAPLDAFRSAHHAFGSIVEHDGMLLCTANDSSWNTEWMSVSKGASAA